MPNPVVQMGRPFLEVLQGPAGPPGPEGPQGEQGIQGVPGSVIVRNVIISTADDATALTLQARTNQTADLVRIEAANGRTVMASRHDSTSRTSDRVVLGLSKVQRDTYGLWDNAVGLSLTTNRGEIDAHEWPANFEGTDDPSTYSGRDSTALVTLAMVRHAKVEASTDTTFTATTVTITGFDATTIKPGMIVDIPFVASGVATSGAGNTITVAEWRASGAPTATPPNGSEVYVDYVSGAWGANFIAQRRAGVTLGKLIGLEIDTPTDQAAPAASPTIGVTGLLIVGNIGSHLGTTGIAAQGYKIGAQLQTYSQYGLVITGPVADPDGVTGLIGAIAVNPGAGDVDIQTLLNLSGASNTAGPHFAHNVNGDKLILFGTGASGYVLGSDSTGGRAVVSVPAGAGLAVRPSQASGGSTSGTDAVVLFSDGTVSTTGVIRARASARGEVWVGNDGTNGSIEIGQATPAGAAAQSPFIDFHYTDGAVFGQDFNTRISNNADNTLSFYRAGSVLLVQMTSSGIVTAANLLSVPGRVDATGSLRAQGNTAPAAGAGAEIGYAAGTAYLLGFDRGSPAYSPVQVNGLSVDILASSTSKIKVDATGVGYYGHATAAQPAARTLTNWTVGSNAVRTLDRNSFTLQNVFDALCTLIYDQQQSGALG
jgi:hypothetical protein